MSGFQHCLFDVGSSSLSLQLVSRHSFCTALLVQPGPVMGETLCLPALTDPIKHLDQGLLNTVEASAFLYPLAPHSAARPLWLGLKN